MNFKLDETSMVRPGEAELMAKELRKLPVEGRMLELGTGFGHSTAYFSHLKPKWVIYTLDGYGEFGTGRNLFNEGGNHIKIEGLHKTRDFIDKNGGKNIAMLIGNTVEYPWEFPLNALFIDADHSYDWVKKDTEHYMEFVIKGGIIMYHDYNDNWEVKEYFDKEMEGRSGWKTWNEGGIAFAKRL